MDNYRKAQMLAAISDDAERKVRREKMRVDAFRPILKRLTEKKTMAFTPDIAVDADNKLFNAHHLTRLRNKTLGGFPYFYVSANVYDAIWATQPMSVPPCRVVDWMSDNEVLCVTSEHIGILTGFYLDSKTVQSANEV